MSDSLPSDDEESYHDSQDEDSEIDFADMDDVTGRREAQQLLDDMLVQDSTNDDLADAGGDRSARLSILQMLLRNARAGSGQRVFVMDDDEEDDDYLWYPRMRGERYIPTPSTAQSAGVKLGRSGMFGYLPKQTSLNWAIRNRTKTQRSLRPEYLGIVPNSSGCLVARNSAPVYSGEYSGDGELFYTADRWARTQSLDVADPTAGILTSMYTSRTSRCDPLTLAWRASTTTTARSTRRLWGIWRASQLTAQAGLSPTPTCLLISSGSSTRASVLMHIW